jgi:hypothetical protein
MATYVLKHGAYHDAGHYPMLSHTEELSRLLLAEAERF